MSELHQRLTAEEFGKQRTSGFSVEWTHEEDAHSTCDLFIEQRTARLKGDEHLGAIVLTHICSVYRESWERVLLNTYFLISLSSITVKQWSQKLLISFRKKMHQLLPPCLRHSIPFICLSGASNLMI